MPDDDQEPSRSSRPPSAIRRRDGRTSPVNLTLLIGFAILATLVALFILPAHPNKSWVAGTASTMIWISVFIIAGCLVNGALYLWHADFRALVQHFRFTRMGMFSLAILLPPGIGFLAYGIVLLQGPTLWNRLIFALICGPLVAGAVLLVIAQFAGQLAIKEIQEYFGLRSLERPSGHHAQSTQPPDPSP